MTQAERTERLQTIAAELAELLTGEELTLYTVLEHLNDLIEDLDKQ